MKLLTVCIVLITLSVMNSQKEPKHANDNSPQSTTDINNADTYKNSANMHYQKFRKDFNLLYTNHQNMRNQKGC
ncbi:MAG: hypothetical protein V4580_18710 [Bacteroidota bacterium]